MQNPTRRISSLLRTLEYPAIPFVSNARPLRVSLFYLVGLFDLWSGIRTLFISSAGAYLIASYVDGPFMPWIGFVFIMGHMSVNHLHRQFANAPTEVDITGAFVRKPPSVEACSPRN